MTERVARVRYAQADVIGDEGADDAAGEQWVSAEGERMRRDERRKEESGGETEWT